MEFQDIVKMRREDLREKIEGRRKEVVKDLNEKWQRKEEEAKLKICGLPNELWAEILPHIRDPQDLGNMWKAHSRFRPLSEESQTLVYLLSQLLSIEKLPYLWEDNTTRLSKLKMFRTFSRGMRTAVDSLMEENLLNALGTNEDRSILSYEIGPNPIFGSLKCLRGVHSNFCGEGLDENLKAKRVFHRSLSLYISEPVMKGRTYRLGGRLRPNEILVLYPSEKTKVTSLLETIGHQIWYFRTSVSAEKLNAEYPFLRQCVSQMPNLKWFTFLIPPYQGFIAEETLENFPFPHLPHLKRIKFGGLQNVRSQPAVVASVIRPNLHIKVLEFEGYMPENNLFFTGEELAPLLEMMNLDGFYGNYEWTRLQMEVLRPRWNLKSFSHSFRADSKHFELATLINSLNNYMPTLEHLTLHKLHVYIGDEEILLPPLRLPHLTHFNWKFDLRSVNLSGGGENLISFTSLQFLLESKKLESLSWDYNAFLIEGKDRDFMRKFIDFMRKHEVNERIQFKCGHHQDMTSSNIWNVFPRLEYVNLRVTREDGKWGWVGREIRKSKMFMIN